MPDRCFSIWPTMRRLVLRKESKKMTIRSAFFRLFESYMDFIRREGRRTRGGRS